MKSINTVLDEFLDAQEIRLSESTFQKYDSIIELYRSYLEAYWPGHDQKEYERITKQGGTFCGTFGPEELPGGFNEFLDYFMPRKVLAGAGTIKAAGTVIKKLAQWLEVPGEAHIGKRELSLLTETAREALARQKEEDAELEDMFE